jgi:hypothetical protein
MLFESKLNVSYDLKKRFVYRCMFCRIVKFINEFILSKHNVDFKSTEIIMTWGV